VTATATTKKVREAHVKSLERALREERLALAAIVKVMLIEVPDPARVLARLDAMTRAAEANPRTARAVVKQLLDATLFVKTAIERETGRPQSLFDPHVGHVKDTDVDRLVEPSEGPQQLGLQQGEGLLGDAEAAHQERVEVLGRIHNALIELYRQHGALSDADLHTHYKARAASFPQERLPVQTKGALDERRRELAATGRIVRSGGKWTLVEAAA
jgi:hypothetical protein